jgi:4-hydroxybenzoate polyprenyltransferase
MSVLRGLFMSTVAGIYLLMQMSNKQAVIFTIGIFIFFFFGLYLISSNNIILVIEIVLIIATIYLSVIWKEKEEE